VGKVLSPLLVTPIIVMSPFGNVTITIIEEVNLREFWFFIKVTTSGLYNSGHGKGNQ